MGAEFNPFTPHGEMEQIVRFAKGIRDARGWRRPIAIVFGVLSVALFAFLVFAVIVPLIQGMFG